jgi:hypothetical protein
MQRERDAYKPAAAALFGKMKNEIVLNVDSDDEEGAV